MEKFQIETQFNKSKQRSNRLTKIIKLEQTIDSKNIDRSSNDEGSIFITRSN